MLCPRYLNYSWISISSTQNTLQKCSWQRTHFWNVIISSHAVYLKTVLYSKNSSWKMKLFCRVTFLVLHPHLPSFFAKICTNFARWVKFRRVLFGLVGYQWRHCEVLIEHKTTNVKKIKVLDRPSKHRNETNKDGTTRDWL